MKRALLLLSLMSLSIGCGANTDDLFTASPSDGSGGSHASTSSTPTSAQGTTTGAGTTSGTASGTGATSTSSGPSSSVATASSTSSGPLLPTVSCNDAPCMPGQVCCYYMFGAGQDTCAAPGQCPDPMNDYAVLACDGPADCPGQECCGGWTNQDGWLYTKCASSCGANELVMCAGAPNACMGQTCKPSMALGQGYSFCGG